MLNTLLFAAFPYVAIVLALLVGIFRYFSDRFTFSSQSSQFLENRTLFWGSVPWHYGIIAILTAHLLAFIFPHQWAAIIGEPARLYIMEITGLALAVVTIIGMSILILRRLTNRRVLVVTSPMDWVLLASLLAQVVLGFLVALLYRWGADWYLQKAVPWLMSLLKLNPQLQHVTVLPWIVKLHLLGGFFIIALFPFTRLVHFVAYPFTYLWRPYQVVVWYRRRARVGVRAVGLPVSGPSTPAQATGITGAEKESVRAGAGKR